MDLSTSIDGDLVAGADTQARVVAWTEVHETLASGRISLFIDRAGDGESGSDAGTEFGAILQLRSINVDGRGLCAGGNVGSGSRGDSVLDVRTRNGICMEGLDVEDNGNDIHVEPKASAQIGSLGA